MKPTTTAEMIFSQLGGHRFKLMTGAKHFLTHGDGLTFKIPSWTSRRGINFVRVTRDTPETYTMFFAHIYYDRRELVEVNTYINVHTDTLQSIFMEETGIEI